MSVRFGSIGGGVMGEALLSRLIAANFCAPESVLVSEPSAERREFLQQRYGVGVTADNSEAAASDIVLLAVKPQVLELVAVDLAAKGGLKPGALLLSILAGVSLGRLREALGKAAMVRAMPNLPLTVGEGMTAIASSAETTPAQIQQAKEIFSAVGQVVEVPESLMDAVTGLSGSGPAFVAIAIEALADGGVKAGLPRGIASQLALQTVLGTAKLLQESGWHPAELKDRVTSPGGTTIAGVAELEKGGLRSALISAVDKAYERSRELGRS
ncbi:pyrroline-5-carboxylate reductase [Oscillatoria sp. FACHB-1406]|uniref:pyrroline-5-carboxylate reductase n=1 Tax=Oscillatoria sp. FACHB-1406 TaxID=2692846 RepID=UPI0016883519|nr:pyrroline-5-carboxylate reductase [Oscillatoria sp. FACHB-1406]